MLDSGTAMGTSVVRESVIVSGGDSGQNDVLCYITWSLVMALVMVGWSWWCVMMRIGFVSCLDDDSCKYGIKAMVVVDSM